MTQRILSGVRVAILAADGFEQVELTRPRKQLIDHGAEVEIVSLRRGSIRGMNMLAPGKKVKVDRTIFSANPWHYDALLIPGGTANPDFLRQSDEALEFVRSFDRAGKPIAAICHGPWVLISAGLVRGRRLASWPGIRDDVHNAGGVWEDEALVKDRNWITSRHPGDLPRFNAAIVEHFSPALVPEERRHALPYGWLAAGGLAVLGLGLLARWLAAREHRGTSWLPEWLEGSKHPGEASIEAYQELVREDITGPLAASAANTADAGDRGGVSTSWR
ncbi:MAG TPA: type 1 glutamine amidotransferase domain-containing protein [Haliangium sp.]|nr:type 1 glutamine amidotransferase domain-containing protein [Haliangium sp.]